MNAVSFDDRPPTSGPAAGVPLRTSVSAATSEARLVREAQGGSADAIEVLVRRHWADAHRAAFLIVRDAAGAEDIAQEAMLAAVAAIGDFDRRRPLKPWLHRIVANRSLDWLRAQERRPRLVGPGEEQPDAPVHDPAVGAAAPQGVDVALAQLAPDQRAIIVLRHVLDYRSREIAQMLDLPAATVRTRLRRGLEQVRETLTDSGGLQ